jgi:hypothetical protein
MLYRPLVWIFYTPLKTSGIRSFQVAQVITALSGAIGLGLYYLWLRKLVKSDLLAAFTTLGMGASWSYWVFSTDVYYIVLAATCITGCFLLLSSILKALTLPVRSLLGLGVMVALAVLLWQANIFFIPIIIIILYVRFSATGQFRLAACGWHFRYFVSGTFSRTLVVNKINVSGFRLLLH